MNGNGRTAFGGVGGFGGCMMVFIWVNKGEQLPAGECW